MTTVKDDHYYMQHALGLAAEAVGTTAPNPTVACVVVKGDKILSEAVTASGGRPHAETQALKNIDASNATIYVTLEPCSHQGETPPCVEAVIAAKPRRVVIATQDPDPRVAGRGIAALKKAGIEVEVGVCKAEAQQLNAGFFMVQKQGRPLITLKLATSLDGKIATATGESKWITGEEAREFAHGLRATHDAIMVGINTVLADDPQLTCRLPGKESRSPIRVVVDSNGRIPKESKLVKSAAQFPVWVMSTVGELPYKAKGVKLFSCTASAEGTIDIHDALKLLAKAGITRLLVEGGGRLAASLLKAAVVDELIWIRAPRIIGNDGIPAIGNLGLQMLNLTPRFTPGKTHVLGEDRVEVFGV